MLDTLLPQVLGRRADMARFTGTRPLMMPIGAVAPVASARTDVFDRRLPTETQSAAAKEAASPKTPAARAGEIGAPARGAAMRAGYASLAPGGSADDAASTRPRFSREGSLIATLLSRAASARAGSVPLSAPVLLCPNGMPAPAALATLLSQQVVFSGLFYESHLSKWFEGTRPLAQLVHEPHNQPPPPSAANAAAVPPKAPPALPLLSAASRSGVMRHEELPGGAPDTLDADGESELVDDHLAPIVRQQLDTLSTSAFRWHGAAWPGAGMQWEIHEQAPDTSDDTGTAQAPPFSTRIRIDLPRLGMLELVLELDGGRVEVYAYAASGRGADAVQSATSVLEQRFQKAGFVDAHVRLIEAGRA